MGLEEEGKVLKVEIMKVVGKGDIQWPDVDLVLRVPLPVPVQEKPMGITACRKLRLWSVMLFQPS